MPSASASSPAPWSVTLARSDADGFDIALRRRADPERSTAEPVIELVVNGMFAMDSTDSSSEIALAHLAPPHATRVLVGGLGLGFTAAEVLRTRPHAQVEIVELSAALVGWAHDGVTSTLRDVAADSRCHITVADVAEVLRGRTQPQGPWDAILLDVDNGPDFLIHEHNAALYEPDLLEAAVGHLTPGGVLAVWSEHESSALASDMERLSAECGVEHVIVHRDRRCLDYAIHHLTRR